MSPKTEGSHAGPDDFQINGQQLYGDMEMVIVLEDHFRDHIPDEDVRYFRGPLGMQRSLEGLMYGKNKDPFQRNRRPSFKRNRHWIVARSGRGGHKIPSMPPCFLFVEGTLGKKRRIASSLEHPSGDVPS